MFEINDYGYDKARNKLIQDVERCSDCLGKEDTILCYISSGVYFLCRYHSFINYNIDRDEEETREMEMTYKR